MSNIVSTSCDQYCHTRQHLTQELLNENCLPPIIIFIDSLYSDLFLAVGEVSTGRFWLLPPGLL